MWRGGCLREGSFVVQSTTSLTVHFKSDASVSKGGFELHYETNGPTQATRIPAPGGAANICSKHGRRQNDGTCKCSIGFTGEDCSNHIVCCTDPSRCHDAVCDLDPRKVIVVAGELGDDAGTGEMMNSSETGTASKAVRSLAKAIAMSSDGDTIFMYPGMYRGLQNRNLNVTNRNISIRAMKGSYWTALDCERSGRALDVSAASFLRIEGLTIQNCLALVGGAIRVANAELDLVDVVIVDASATQDGGGLYGFDSSVTMAQSVVSNCSAANNGGGLHLLNSSLFLTHSNISACTALNGGSMALVGSTVVEGLHANLTENVATTDGGAIFALDGDVAVDGVSVHSNRANRGAGIAVQSTRFQLKDVFVRNNVASAFGGGLAFVGEVDAVIVESSVLSNHAGAFGGGVYVFGEGTLDLGGASVSVEDLQGRVLLL